MRPLLVDSDVLIKLSRYDLLDLLRPPEDLVVQVLGTARFVVASRLRAHPDALARFLALLPTLVELEPTDEEAQSAAHLLDTAVAKSLAVDGGEGLLLVLLHRSPGGMLLTGDRRAIAGAEGLLKEDAEIAGLAGRLRCLEHVLLEALQQSDLALKSKICADPEADRAMAICFSCSTDRDDSSEQRECLQSYIEHTRKLAPVLLAAE